MECITYISIWVNITMQCHWACMTFSIIDCILMLPLPRSQLPIQDTKSREDCIEELLCRFGNEMHVCGGGLHWGAPVQVWEWDACLWRWAALRSSCAGLGMRCISVEVCCTGFCGALSWLLSIKWHWRKEDGTYFSRSSETAEKASRVPFTVVDQESRSWGDCC